MRKKLSILGSTGSIGKNALKVVRHLNEELEVVALAAKSQIDLLEEQAREFSPKLIAVFDSGRAQVLQERMPQIPVLSGIEGLQAVAAYEETDFALLAMTGSAGIWPAIAAIEAGKQIGLANKEVMISAGELIQGVVQKKGIDLIPVDSEHCALFQCLRGEKKEQVRRLILTASGGPFLNKTLSEMTRVTLEEAMAHPNFCMGPKVTIDSSTLMNKGFEMIEARWLYGIDPSQIEALIHPQQKVHSCVEFVDGSILAQISEPDMLLPIQYALTFPERKPGLLPPYDFFKNQTLNFFPIDRKKFRCFNLAIEALQAGKSYPCFLNAANEILVERFLKKEIAWLDIGTKLDKLISSHDPQNLLSLEAVLEVDSLAREKASRA